MEVGKKYYIISHAYFHYIGTVTRIITPKMVSLADVVAIHSSQRSWTDFFRDGMKTNDRFDVVPDMPQCSVINSYEWHHSVLRNKK